jgi:hypothetical protein
MATLDWPAGTTWAPARFALSATTPRSAWASFFTGQQQSIAHAGNRLRIDMTLPPCTYAAAAYREAFLLQLASTGDYVRLGHFQRPMIAGDLRGSPVAYENTAAGARTLRVSKGTTPNTLLTATQTFNSAADWTVVGDLVVTPNVAERPDSSTLTADRIEDTSTTLSSNISQTVAVLDDSATYTASIYVLKTSGGTSKTLALFMIFYGGSSEPSRDVRINTDTGAILSGTAVVTSSADGEYWRLSASLANNGTGNTTLQYRIDPARCQHNSAVTDVTATGSHVVWGAQLEQRSSVSTYEGTPEVKGGDVLSVGASQLLIVGPDGAQQIGVPYIAVPLALPLRTAVTAGDVVAWNKPTGNFQLLGDSLAAIQYLPGRYQAAIELQFGEVY